MSTATTTEALARPILFSGPMVRAILDGAKTQTRRVVVPQYSTPRVAPLTMEPWLIDGEQEVDDHGLPCWAGFHPDYPGEAKWFSCPYGRAGDQLWVRETFWIQHDSDIYNDHSLDCGIDLKEDTWAGVRYCATDIEPSWKYHSKRPAIHMPRWASRISLEITGVRVERVQDITEADMRSEGLDIVSNGEPVAGFRVLWDSINARRGYPWESNPWIWVVSFKRITTTTTAP